ncbi:hypothetical protein APS67_003538 [Streptomyces sp. AVP053U2]|nr:hypothetical protein APS67_003538 [Streptomyces sp. AVP053U2]
MEAVQVDRFGAGRGPHGRVEAVLVAGAGGEGAGGVPGPRLVVVAVGAGVEAEGAAAGAVGAADPHLHLDAAVLGQGERGGEGEVLDAVAADLVAGPYGQFQEGGAGQQDGAAHRVVGEPGVGAHREAAGEQQSVGVGEGDGGGQQRVVGGAQAGGPYVAGEAGDALRPVRAVLEGVRRQVGAAGAGALEPALPAQRHTVQVQAGGGLGERGGLGTVLAQGGQDGGVLVSGGVQAGAAERGQGAVGAEFEEDAGAVSGQPADAVGEADGAADVVGPVVGGGQLLDRGGPAGQVGDHGQRGGLRGQPGDDVPELREHRLHQRRVEGVRDAQPPGAAAESGEVGGDGVDGVDGARDDHGRGAVEGGDRHPVGVLGDERGHLVLGGFDGDHGAALGQRLHQPSAGEDQGAGVLQGEDARDVRGGDLADRVAGDVVGGEAPGLDQPVQGDFEGEEGGLRVSGAVQESRLGGALPGQQEGTQRAVESGVEVAEDPVEGACEDGEADVQVAAHAGALGALAGEEHGELGAFARPVDGEARRVLAGGEGGEGGEGGVPVCGGERGAVLEGGPGGGQRVGGVEGGERGPVAQVGQQPAGLLAQGVGGAAGQQPRQDAGLDGGGRGGLLGSVGGGLLGGSLLDDGVRVGAGQAERGDAGPARGVLPARPRDGLGEEADGSLGPVDVGGRPVHVQGAREQVVAHRHDHLDDAGDAGGGLGVADVGLHRAEQQRLFGGTALAVGGEQRLRLDGVAEDGAGAVRLHGVDLRGGEPGVDQCGLDDPLLGGAVGSGQAVGGAVLVDGRAAHHGEHLVAVAAGLGEPLQDEDADTLGPAGAVGGVGEGLAVAVAREAALAGELDEGGGARHHGDAGRQCQRALPGAQCLGGHVQGDQ